MPIDLFEHAYFEEYNVTLTNIDFSGMPTSLQNEIMKQWFLKRYCDPVENTPYDSGEGGYQYISGGPFDALETLSDQFSDVATDEFIAETARELEEEFDISDWVYTDAFFQHQENSNDQFYEIDAGIQNNDPYLALNEKLTSIEELLNEPSRDKQFQLTMAFVFVVTNLETYLSDIFVKNIFKPEIDYNTREKFLRASRKSTEKMLISEIFRRYDKIDDEIKDEIQNTSFHNLPLVKKLFAEVLDISLVDTQQLEVFIRKRHDFIHRGGKDKDGKEISTDENEIKNLINLAREFTKDINGKLPDFFRDVF
ncbi:MAG: hypothetical protein K2Y18_02180 [Alphaproteobacteria bacterium]|jgi:transcription termination factor NusB|nr:hypothetical protein [Alphaproteobacteria bacterium]